MSIAASNKRFQKIGLTTIVLLFVLILAGGVVRSTGSGMGCPDWPKCLGRYIPPTSINDLPKDYKQKYVDQRFAKNQRFANALDLFGFSDLAKRIREDRSILIPEDFNAGKTWTEYVNRLIGEITGLFLLASTIYAFSYWKMDKRIPLLSLFNLVLIAFQAWLGSIVVSTNLVAWIVTVHMLLALAILALCIYTYHLARVYGNNKLNTSPAIYIITLIALALSVLQITFGTEVREKIDAVATHFQGGYRDNWIKNAGEIFTHHRDMAILVFIINVALYALVRKRFNRHSIHQQLMSFNFLMIMLQIVTGILLSYWALPPVAQAAHILLASLIFGAQFYLLLNLHQSVNVRGLSK
ncbi:COX15/CtaA family protein [Mucilaginibacter sp. FT3.2]|uniref:COX15/CtaA family protein n=1 Tax=Mucilaginibacter sp. FT3.2 TaxID=2723090 RepID=UPI00160DDFBD|nr:COX15/CtaA family protein [Mucilaginibacter sp. FT3.2]MBB6231078.1 cytochrome c oxidase assembly protein subunit 15 [Mucilaginibacter sp. FT3.2]